MSTLVAERDLPKELTTEQAVEAAYAAELAEATEKLRRGLPVLVESDKDLAPFLYQNVRTRLKSAGLPSR
jgi:cell division protease FtsH